MRIVTTKSNFFQELDLEKELGFDVSHRPELGVSIGQAVIDYIIDRVDSNAGLGNKDLKPTYSDAYADSLIFKAFGKSKGDVNMKLTGAMLSAVDILEFDGNKIKYGVDDTTEILKAYNHQTGDTVPERPWFGVTKDEFRGILHDFKSDIQAARREREQLKESESRTFDSLAQIAGAINDESLPSFRDAATVRSLASFLDDSEGL